MENIFSTPLLIIGFPLVMSLLLVVVGLLLYREVRKRPDEELAWLRPYLFQAIVAGYKMSEANVDEFGERLHGMDKRQVAESSYAYLPDEIRALVSPELFAEGIEWLFAEGETLYETNADSFQQAFEAWREENEEENI